MSVPALQIESLGIGFRRADGGLSRVVDGVSLAVMPGEITGVVGESGSGKSLTARAALRLFPASAEVSGRVAVGGEDVLAMPPARLRALRGADVAMVFQDPMTSFDPVQRIGAQIAEAIAIHAPTPREALGRRVADLLARVGITRPEERARAWPHEFSGGMRQRAMIAMAVANSPPLLIADEPTTALDVTVQDQVLRLMRALNAETGMAILLITHNIAVVASLCHRLVVMYAGRVLEEGPAERVLTAPEHPYTWSLLQSVPRLDRPAERLLAIPGQPPDPADPPSGCRFHPRCPFAEPRCTEAEPPLEAVGEDHRARCWVLMRHTHARARAA